MFYCQSCRMQVDEMDWHRRVHHPEEWAIRQELQRRWEHEQEIADARWRGELLFDEGAGL